MATRRFTAEIVVTSDDVLLDNVVEVPPPFGAAELLDNFIRSNEDPLSNEGRWSAFSSFVENSGEIKEEGWQSKGSTESGAYWNSEEFVEPVIIVELHKIGNKERDIYLVMSESPNDVAKGYVALIEEETTESKFNVRLYRRDTSTHTEIGTKQSGLLFVAGDKFALSVEKGKVKIWRKHGTESWSVVNEANDSTYAKGYVGFATPEIPQIGKSFSLRNFEAGSLA
jgi:hypothetical protein